MDEKDLFKEKIEGHNIHCHSCGTKLVMYKFGHSSIGFQCPAGCRFGKKELDITADLITNSIDMRKLDPDERKKILTPIVVGASFGVLFTGINYYLVAFVTTGGTDLLIMRFVVMTTLAGFSLSIFGFLRWISRMKKTAFNIYWLR